MFTRVIFQGPVEIVKEATTGQRRVITTKQVEAGELLFVEHRMVSDKTVLMYALLTDPLLFAALYPRPPEPVETLDERIKLAILKLNNNVFRAQGDKFALYDAMAAINHSCVANVGASSCQFGIGSTCACIVSLTALAQGEELFINYGNNLGHLTEAALALSQEKETLNFQCQCGRNEEQRHVANELQKCLIQQYNVQQQTKIDTLLNEYTQTMPYKVIHVRQALAEEGCFQDGAELLMLDSFRELMKRLYPDKTANEAFYEYVHLRQEQLLQ